MIKKVAMLLLLMLTVGLFEANKYSQHILVRLINPQVQVAGVQLMMPEAEVLRLLGTEEQRVQGFGGYWLAYPSKGIAFSFLKDYDTDFYQRVSEIKVSDPAHLVLGVRVGDDYEKALAAVRSRGFTRDKEGFPGLWKANAYIVLEANESGAVKSVTLGVRDKVASTRVY